MIVNSPFNLLTMGFTHEEDSATLGSDMSASWGLPGAMPEASLFYTVIENISKPAMRVVGNRGRFL